MFNTYKYICEGKTLKNLNKVVLIHCIISLFIFKLFEQ